MRKKDMKINLFLLAAVLILYIVYSLFIWLTSLNIYQWFIIISLILACMMLRRKYKHKKRMREAEERKEYLERQSNLKDLMKMDWLEFEKYICDLFIQLGFEASLTSATGDGGKDILIYKDNFFAVAECKRYSKTNKVTRPDIQKFHSAIIDCKADKGFFITTGEFTKYAESYVLDKPIKLINGEKLVEMIQHGTKFGANSYMKNLLE